MWTVYKKEIIAQEKENGEFLKHYYSQNKAKQDGSLEGQAGKVSVGPLPAASNDNEDAESEDWPIQLDSDEEMPQKPK